MGFQRLSSEEKSKAKSAYNLYSKMKSNLFNSGLDKIFKPEKNNLKVNVTTDNFGNLGTSFKLLVDKYVLAENKNEGSEALSMIFAASNTAPNKIDFDIDRENQRLIHKFDLGAGRSQKIYITADSKIKTEGGETMIRITSPCLDLSEIKKPITRPLLFDFLKKKYKKDLGDLCFDLLLEQGQSHFICRYFWDFKNKYLCVIRDYLLSATRMELDLMEPVARIADNTERRFNIIDKY